MSSPVIHDHPDSQARAAPAVQQARADARPVPQGRGRSRAPGDRGSLQQLAFGLYENDKFGDCGPTSVANLVRLVSGGLTGTEVQPSQDDVFDLYRRSGNPNFDPTTDADDNGVDMQTMLEALLAGGIGDGKGNKIKPIAFAKVDVSSDDQLTAAVSIFGGVLWGVDLQVAQQTQTDAHPPKWDYQQSGEWGGHAIVNGAYEAGALEDVISWGQRIETTQAFRRHQLQEAWVVVWQWNIDHPAFQAGVDLQRARRRLQEPDRPRPAASRRPRRRRPPPRRRRRRAVGGDEGVGRPEPQRRQRQDGRGAQGLGGRQAPVSESRARDISASRNFCTRPTAVSGSSDACARKIVRGTLKRASWSAQNATSSSTAGSAPARGTTHAHGTSPICRCGIPTTKACEHLRVGLEHRLDLLRHHHFAAHPQRLLQAPGQPQVAVRAQRPEVARAQPAVRGEGATRSRPACL